MGFWSTTFIACLHAGPTYVAPVYEKYAHFVH